MRRVFLHSDNPSPEYGSDSCSWLIDWTSNSPPSGSVNYCVGRKGWVWRKWSVYCAIPAAGSVLYSKCSKVGRKVRYCGKWIDYCSMVVADSAFYYKRSMIGQISGKLGGFIDGFAGTSGPAASHNSPSGTPATSTTRTSYGWPARGMFHGLRNDKDYGGSNSNGLIEKWFDSRIRLSN